MYHIFNLLDATLQLPRTPMQNWCGCRYLCPLTIVKRQWSGFVVGVKAFSVWCCSLKISLFTSYSVRVRRLSWLNRKSSCLWRTWEFLWSTTTAAKKSPLSGSRGELPHTHTVYTQYIHIVQGTTISKLLVDLVKRWYC